MSIWELCLVALSLSMDAFAVSVCTGLTMEKVLLRKALVVGIYFGVFQALMPLIGYLAGTLFADRIVAVDHWIAFVLLAFIGGKMIKESFERPDCGEEACGVPAQASGDVALEGATQEQSLQEASLGPARMLPLALATSIDALAVGITLALLDVQIVPAVTFIGVVTLVVSMVGVKIGNLFGSRFKSKAELAGGVVLVLIGLKILLEHLRVFG